MRAAFTPRRPHRLRLVPNALFAAATVATAAAGSGIASAADNGNWTQYRSTPTHNTHVSSGVEDLFSGAISTDGEVRATPVVAGGKLFIGNHGTGALQAYDLTDGRQLWKSSAPNWVHSEMIYADGAVFVGYGNRFFNPDGTRGTGESGVISLDPETGEERWRFPTPGEVMPTPVALDGAVYAVTGDRHLYKLDATTGTELKNVDIGHVVSMSSPAEHDGTLYFGSGSPAPYTFQAYDTETESIAWQHPLGEFDRGLDDVPPAVDEDVVVTTGNATRLPGLSGPLEEHTIVAMDEATGAELWRRPLGSGQAPDNNRSGAPTIADGTVFVGSPTTAAVYAFDLRTGEQLWRNPIGKVLGAPVVSGGDVYFSTTAGDVYRVDKTTGAINGKLELSGKLAPAGPIIVDDSLVVGSQSSHVYITPLSEVPDFTVPATSPLSSVVDPLGSAATVSGSIGVDAGSLDAPY
ncbi:outer membrane protein assembly factor BamB family protein [Dietzia sp.]|uniref:outer membrane protein assembly factor BamB family protein n=1 Tax=Dietzia sp. TaxID=1871616 RepID=UPI002FD922F6